MKTLKPKPINYHDPQKLKAALMLGEEREAAKLSQERLRQCVRAGLFAAIAEEVVF